MNNSSSSPPLEQLYFAEYRFPDTFEIVLCVVLLSVVVLLTIVGNGFVVTAFMMNRKLRTNPNAYIVSLAAADCLVAVLSVPLWMYYLLTQDYSNQVLFTVFNQFDIFSGIASIVHLTLVSLERMYAIIRPLEHKMSMLRKGEAKLLAVIQSY